MSRSTWIRSLAAVAALSLLAGVASAQDKPKEKPADKPAPKADDKKPAAGADAKKPAEAAPGGDDQAAMMEMMMKLAEPNENHKLLAQAAGDWTYTLKHYMDPAHPSTSTGTATFTPVKGGRFVIGEHKGKFQMPPGADGKTTDFMFEGTGITGYDNVKKQFTSAWIDNMGTMIVTSTGSYDAATKTFTYSGEFEMAPGMSSKFRQLIKYVDNDHHRMEWYENMGAGESKTMEIEFTRKK